MSDTVSLKIGCGSGSCIIMAQLAFAIMVFVFYADTVVPYKADPTSFAPEVEPMINWLDDVFIVELVSMSLSIFCLICCCFIKCCCDGEAFPVVVTLYIIITYITTLCLNIWLESEAVPVYQLNDNCDWYNINQSCYIFDTRFKPTFIFFNVLFALVCLAGIIFFCFVGVMNK